RGGVSLRMADVQARAARIREHVEHVKLRLRGIEIGVARIRRAEGFVLVPKRLPLRLDRVEGVSLASFVCHDGDGYRGRRIFSRAKCTSNAMASLSPSRRMNSMETQSVRFS